MKLVHNAWRRFARGHDSRSNRERWEKPAELGPRPKLAQTTALMPCEAPPVWMGDCLDGHDEQIAGFFGQCSSCAGSSVKVGP
jgi:hypothetical protein